ncbi:MarR family winged helix-turn-helix transcriptional regulator (plasmid) [Streptomyces sp. AHU1]|uniref:MarR family winged helix-turn-helix transcriptional regulator n=1 Tax=Streptomyces sp. AHU1 TaxID=3377215 RepID=UPI003877BC53
MGGSDDEWALESQVCFALDAANRACAALYRILLHDAHLTHTQYLVMAVLWERDNVSVKELGNALRLESGTLSPLLKRLEAAGHVRRRRHPLDERSVRVHITREGAALQERLRSVPRRIAASMDMDEAALVDLRDRLDQLITAFDATTASLRR